MANIGQLASQKDPPAPQRRRRRLGHQGWLLFGLLLLYPVAASADASARDSDRDGDRHPPREQTSDDELRALQRSALRSAHLDERSLRGLQARLRVAAFLPNVRLSVGRGMQWSYPSQSDVTSALTLGGDRISYSLSADWDLGRLIFAREDLTLYRDAQRMAPGRTQLLLRVARLYALRCQVERERRRGEPDDSRLGDRAFAAELALVAVTGDEHAGRKHQHCPAQAGPGLASELDALNPSPPSPYPITTLPESGEP
jgi:hypothetical protein